MAYAPVLETGGETLNFKAGEGLDSIRDEETGTLWSIRTGMGLKGPFQGTELSPIPAQLAFWFAWSSFYPETELVSTP